MRFDAEIGKGVSCHECSFNKGEDGCLLVKRLDEIEITPEPCEDAVPRTSVEYICRKNTVSTNPYEHKYHDKFIQFMDDPEISDFGRWQYSNGFNTALVAVKCDLDKVPTAQPEPLTDKEQRIFLKAISREREVCQKVDGEYSDDDSKVSLVKVCNSIERKVKKIWG